MRRQRARGAKRKTASDATRARALNCESWGEWGGRGQRLRVPTSSIIGDKARRKSRFTFSARDQAHPTLRSLDILSKWRFFSLEYRERRLARQSNAFYIGANFRGVSARFIYGGEASGFFSFSGRGKATFYEVRWRDVSADLKIA